MTILESDIRFRAAQRMTDYDDGGGRMSANVIVDGADNNVFDDIPDLDRVTGRVSLRKVFGACLSNTSEAYLSAHVLLDSEPTDPATNGWIFQYGGATTERAAAAASLVESYVPPAAVSLAWDGGSTYLWSATEGAMGAFQPFYFVSADYDLGLVLVTASSNGTNPFNGLSPRARYTTSAALPGSSGTTYSGLFVAIPLPALWTGIVKRYGAAATVQAAATADRVLYVGAGYLKTSAAGGYTFRPVVTPGDAVVVHHTTIQSPATVANGDTVDCGRINLAQIRVIGNNGVEIARFTDGQTAPTGVGCAANLPAGTITFSDVSGMAQPVTIWHRIEEMAAVSDISVDATYGGAVRINRALSRAYPVGTLVSSLLQVGDLQGRPTGIAFSQTAWTGVWSDSRIGGDPPGEYNASGSPILCTNKGSVTERWYVEFTNTTAYRVVGEFFGQIGTGTTGANFAPNNPATGAPYFTLQASGWGSGWAAGNVFRFNTAGANTPVWVARVVKPSTPAGNDQLTLQLRGYVNV